MHACLYVCPICEDYLNLKTETVSVELIWRLFHVHFSTLSNTVWSRLVAMVTLD